MYLREITYTCTLLCEVGLKFGGFVPELAACPLFTTIHILVTMSSYLACSCPFVHITVTPEMPDLTIIRSM